MARAKIRYTLSTAKAAEEETTKAENSATKVVAVGAETAKVNADTLRAKESKKKKHKEISLCK